MSKIFGDTFGRAFHLLKGSWRVLLYPFPGVVAGFIVMVPIALVAFLMYFRPLFENIGNMNEDEAALYFIQYLFSPGLVGALYLVAFILIAIGVQAYLSAALNGTFRDIIRGQDISLGRYFRNGLAYWSRVFFVILAGLVLLGVPAILYMKFGVIQNLPLMIRDPGSVGLSVLMGFIVSILLTFVISLLYNLLSFFWLPSLIVGERDLVEGFQESARLGFKNILYLIVLVVVQLFTGGILSFLNNINQESIPLVIIVIIGNYVLNMYFGFFKFVWYEGITNNSKPPEVVE